MLFRSLDSNYDNSEANQCKFPWVLDLKVKLISRLYKEYVDLHLEKKV